VGLPLAARPLQLTVAATRLAPAPTRSDPFARCRRERQRAFCPCRRPLGGGDRHRASGAARVLTMERETISVWLPRVALGRQRLPRLASEAGSAGDHTPDRARVDRVNGRRLGGRCRRSGAAATGRADGGCAARGRNPWRSSAPGEMSTRSSQPPARPRSAAGTTAHRVGTLGARTMAGRKARDAGGARRVHAFRHGRTACLGSGQPREALLAEPGPRRRQGSTARLALYFGHGRRDGVPDRPLRQERP
jgi:hypothetical protein